jgi:hypothetical protein
MKTTLASLVGTAGTSTADATCIIIDGPFRWIAAAVCIAAIIFWMAHACGKNR